MFLDCLLSPLHPNKEIYPGMMNLINEETEWEHFSHSHSCPACAALFPSSLPVPFSLTPPKAADVLVTLTSCRTNGEGRLKQEGERFPVPGCCCPLTTSQIFYLSGSGFCLIAEENKALMVPLLAFLLPHFTPPWEKGNGLPVERNQGKYQIKMVIAKGPRGIICREK